MDSKISIVKISFSELDWTWPCGGGGFAWTAAICNAFEQQQHNNNGNNNGPLYRLRFLAGRRSGFGCVGVCGINSTLAEDIYSKKQPKVRFFPPRFSLLICVCAMWTWGGCGWCIFSVLMRKGVLLGAPIVLDVVLYANWTLYLSLFVYSAREDSRTQSSAFYLLPPPPLCFSRWAQRRSIVALSEAYSNTLSFGALG